MRRSIVERGAGQTFTLLRIEEGRRETSTVEQRLDRGEIKPAHQRQHSQNQRTWCVRTHHEGAGGAPAQGVIDQRRDRGAVLRSGEAM